MKEEIINIYTSDGFNLKAILCIPNHPKRIVLMCHGIASHKQEYLDMFSILAKKLALKNVASIRFDFRGHGESSGSNLDFDVMSQLIDIETIIYWLGNHLKFKGLPLSFVGVSFGAPPGILHQSIYKSFEKISLFAPVISFRFTFVEPSTEWGIKNFNQTAWREAKKKGYLILDDDFRVSLRLLNEFLFIEPINRIGSLDIPIQLFHGTNDKLVPCSISEKIAFKFPNIDVRIIPKMGHGLYIEGDDDGVSKASKSIQNDYYNNTVEFLS